MGDSEPLKLRMSGLYVDGHGTLVHIRQQHAKSKSKDHLVFIGSNDRVYREDGRVYRNYLVVGDNDHLVDEIVNG